MPEEKAETYRAYLLRCWREGEDSPEKKSTWRFSVEEIPAQGSPDTGASYEYIDTDVVKGMAYYYKLEDVDTHGVSVFHGPVATRRIGNLRIYLPVIPKSCCRGR